MKDQAVVTEQYMYTGLITKGTHETRKKALISMVTSQNNRFVYFEVWKTLTILGIVNSTRESLLILSAVPSAGHVFLIALYTVVTITI